MNQQKGFTLMEVLVSLMLMTTLVLAVLQHQWNTRQLINQILLQAGASSFLDQVEELLYISKDSIPVVPTPYRFKLKQTPSHYFLEIEWFKSNRSLTRIQSR